MTTEATTSKTAFYKLGNAQRGHVCGNFEDDDAAWSGLSRMFRDLCGPNESPSVTMTRTVRRGIVGDAAQASCEAPARTDFPKPQDCPMLTHLNNLLMLQSGLPVSGQDLQSWVQGARDAVAREMSSERADLIRHVQRMLLPHEGVPMNAIAFGKMVREAREAAAALRETSAA